MYVPNTKDCPVCDTTMKYVDDDSRQEWYDTNYYCLTCQVTFTYRYTFEMQSDSVSTADWMRVPKDAPVFTMGQTVFFKPAHNMNVHSDTIFAIHIDPHTFDYHYHLTGFEPCKWFLTADLSTGPREAILLDALYVTIVQELTPTAQEAL